MSSQHEFAVEANGTTYWINTTDFQKSLKSALASAHEEGQDDYECDEEHVDDTYAPPIPSDVYDKIRDFIFMYEHGTRLADMSTVEVLEELMNELEES